MLNKLGRIYVAGHRGLVGSALLRQLELNGFNNVISRTHAQLDLTDEKKVDAFFKEESPEYVFLAAAKVGGISANNNQPVDFIVENLKIQTSVIQACHKYRVKRLLFLGSSCIYPKYARQPLLEDCLLTGELEPTNRPYAVAKIAGIEMCWSYNRQHGTKFLAVMPTNLYGVGDNYDLQNSHVLPALIRKFHEGKMNQSSFVEIWGTGSPRREFLFSDDMADACVFLMGLDDKKFNDLVRPQLCPLINIGVGIDLTIFDLAKMIQEIVGFKGEIKMNPDKPDGTMRKLLDVSKINALGWKAKTSLKEGIKVTYKQFLRQAK